MLQLRVNMEINLIRNLRQTLRKFDREVHFQDLQSCCNGVSFAQCHTLLEIENSNEISISELAKNMSLDKSTTSRTVEGLVNIGLVDRRIPQDNRRTATISLTEQGKKTCDSINFFNDQYISGALEGFSKSDLAQFLLFFEKLANNMEKMRQKVNECKDNRD
jgi:DNA-binding MarR family transcriptional regulator